METPDSINPNEPLGGNPAPAASKLGMIGLILGILGFIVYCGPLTIAFLAGMSGNVDTLGAGGMAALNIISYCGLFFGVIGGILGAVSLARGESKTFGIIAIVLGVLMLCACSMLAIFGAMSASAF